MYEDIIDLPHHVSKTRAHMSSADRAAQFAPFAALTGYEDAIDEAARLTGSKADFDENEKEFLDACLSLLTNSISEKPEISVTYFVADAKKDGGKYVKTSGVVKKIDDFSRMLTMTDKTQIPLDDISMLEGDIFKKLNI